MAIINKQEVQHNTYDQVEHYLAQALSMVETLDPPSDLREIAFQQAVTLLAAKQIMLEQMQGAPLLNSLPR